MKHANLDRCETAVCFPGDVVMAASESSWPGERTLSRNEVASASEVPEPAVVSNFKRSLVAAYGSRDFPKIMNLDLGTKASV